MRSCACDLLGVIHKTLLLPACLTQLCIMSCFTEQVLELIVPPRVVILSTKCYIHADGQGKEYCCSWMPLGYMSHEFICQEKVR